MIEPDWRRRTPGWRGPIMAASGARGPTQWRPLRALESGGAPGREPDESEAQGIASRGFDLFADEHDWVQVERALRRRSSWSRPRTTTGPT